MNEEWGNRVGDMVRESLSQYSEATRGSAEAGADTPPRMGEWDSWRESGVGGEMTGSELRSAASDQQVELIWRGSA